MFFSALAGQAVALWTMGAVLTCFTVYKVGVFLLSIAGIGKSTQQKVVEELSPDLKRLEELHKLLTDKVFAKEQEGRFEDITAMKKEVDRVFPYLKTPPEVVHPPFNCKLDELRKELKSIQVGIETLLSHEREREAQTELICNVLEKTFGGKSWHKKATRKD